MDNLKVGSTDLARTFDMMAASGKLGSFELGAMAQNFPTITASARALGVEGVQGVASISAALQVAMKAAGSEDQAANNLVNFLGKLTAPDTLEKFADFGVDVEKELQLTIERGSDPLEHMLDVINKITDGNSFKMGELFADRQVLDFLRAAIPNLEEFRRIRDASLGATGAIDADYERVMEGFNQSLRGLESSVMSLLGGSGALLPIFAELLQSTTALVDRVSAWTQANPELTGTIVKTAAALVALSVGTTVARYGVALLGGGLLRTASLFLKFNEAGRNVSFVGRGLRVLGTGFRAYGNAAFGFDRRLRGLGRTLSGLPRVRLASLVAPLRWTSFLVPRIKWASFIGTLAMASLITPIRWAGAMLPNFAPALARFVGFRTSASRELVGLERRALLSSQRLTRTMNGMKLTAGLGALSLAAALTNMPSGKEEWEALQAQNRARMEGAFRSIPGYTQFENLWNGLQEKFPSPMAQSTPLAPVSNSSGPDIPGEAPARALSLDEQRQRSIRGQLSELRRGSQAQPTSGVPLSVGRDVIATAIRDGFTAARRAPAGEPRPELRPQEYVAPQPNVEVQSSFESSPSYSVSVAVSMPVTIQAAAGAAGRKAKRDAARQAGAETERAVRRGLDDAAVD